MRPSGPELVDAFTRACMEQGVDVIDLGLASSDLLYFAAGSLDAPGAMFTASHNPAQYNGIKLCLAGARPVDMTAGEIKPVADDGARRTRPGAGADAPGRRTEREPARPSSSSTSCRSSTSTSLRPLRIVADTANGMGGLVVPAVFERLADDRARGDVRRARRHVPEPPGRPVAAGQPDATCGPGSSPVAFDIGLAFDGDADRVFVVDETGTGLSGSTTTALLAAAILRATRVRRSSTT